MPDLGHLYPPVNRARKALKDAQITLLRLSAEDVVQSDDVGDLALALIRIDHALEDAITEIGAADG